MSVNQNQNQTNNFVFVTFVGDKTIIARKEKYSLVALDDGGTCLIPNVFIRKSKLGEEYIALPITFKTEYRYTEYNRETKERKLVSSREVTATEIKNLLKQTNKAVHDKMPF